MPQYNKSLTKSVRHSVNKTYQSLQSKFASVRARVQPYYNPVEKVDFQFVRNVYRR